ncbi:MAG: hypothetical protein GYB68_07120 [Chloroflexi bacterium]|nr:hypothetical protein [Chloroflexota bacterium]
MSDDAHQAMIDFLLDVRQRHRTFIQPQPYAIEHFLKGLQSAASTLGVSLPSANVYRFILRSRGWEVSGISPSAIMRSQGYPESEIIVELLDIEIEAWQQHFTDLTT